MKYFILEELVDHSTFVKYGKECWQLFKPEALDMLDDFREFIGKPVTVNNWNTNGVFQFRGYRPGWCNVGAPNSPHRKGMAFDLDVKGMTAEEVRQEIIKNKDNPLLKNIKRIEGIVNWVHLDTADQPLGKATPYVFHP